jgi:heme exporter protein B
LSEIFDCNASLGLLACSALRAITITFAAMLGKSFVALVKKDLLIEWRQKHTLFGVLLYVGGTVFMVYTMNGQPEPKIWNALFWLTQLFVSVNSVAKSFLQEPANRFRYYFTLVRPATFMLAKMTYSLVLMVLMTMVTLLLFYVLLGWPLTNGWLFVLLSILGSVSLSAVFTFLSAIAARAQQNSSLMAILGFPLVAPMLMILSKLAIITLSSVHVEGWNSLAGILITLDVLIIALGLILFPFLWQE